MARLFAFNSLAGCKRSSTAVKDGDTTAGRFDSGYVASAIMVPSGGDFIETAPFMDGSASVTTFFVRFDCYGSAASTNTWMEFYNVGGTIVARVQTTASTITLHFWNGSAFAAAATISTAVLSATALRTIMVKVVCGSSGSMEIFSGGTSLGSGAVTSASCDNIAKARLYTQGLVSTAYYSQVMGADYDIRSANFMPRLANGEGTYTNGTGVFGDINEAVLDESTAINLPAVGNKHSFTKASITVPTGQQITTKVVNIRGRVSGGVVADGKAFCRSGTTDSASGSKSFNGGYEPRGHAFDNDPNTATRWTQTGFNAAEFGLQAA